MAQWPLGQVLGTIAIAILLGVSILEAVRQTWRAAILSLVIALLFGISVYASVGSSPPYPWWRGALWLALALLFLWRALLPRHRNTE